MSVQISVIIPTYNHEAYIKQCITSVLEQKIDFEIEVLIGEDCSTDTTREILKSMERELPEYFHIFYREKNLYRGNFQDLYSRMQGKYFIVLEGDDFWTYEYKLKEEYDFLETHPDYVAVAHNVQVVNENGYPVNWHIRECKKNEYTLKEFQKGLFPGQTASILARNYYRYNLFDYDIKVPTNYPGDVVRIFLLVVSGRVYCFQEKWSAYRYVFSHGSSYSANTKYDYQSELKYFIGLHDYAKKIKKEPVLKVTEEMYFWCLFKGVLKSECKVTASRWIDEFSNAQFKGMILKYIIKKIFLFPFKKIFWGVEEKYRFRAVKKSFREMNR